MAIPSSTIYYNFSADCINSNYIGFSGREGNIILTPGFLNYSFYFSNVSGCITNCTGLPSEISGCFTFISSGTTPAYPVYTGLTLNPISGIYPTTSGCLDEHPCPVEQEFTYFQFCCPQGVREENNYFGVLTDPGAFQIGATGFIEISSIAACVTTVSSQGLPQSINIFQNVPYNFTSYKDCIECTGSTVGCSTTPVPTPTIYFSSDTRCGDNILRRNECEPIVIFPLGVSCVGTNPTLTTDANGELSLIITGGTPPYDVFWSNGSNGLFITNLSVGSYSAIVTDYYRDFTAYTTCTLTAPTPTPMPTETPTPTPVPEGEPFCLSITTDEYIPTSVQYYFYPTGNLVNGRPEYTDGNGHDITWNLGAPAYWSLGNPPGSYDIISYEIPDPPLTGWQFVDGPTGTIVSNLGQCPGYPNLCLNFMQIKDSTSPVYSAQQTMVYNGIVNGRPSWLSLDGLYIISWDLGFWRVVTSEPLWNTMASSNPQIPPVAGWSLAGSVNPASFVNVTQGNCTPSAAAAAQTTFGNENARTNQPTENPDLKSSTSYNGNILLRATSGTGPFQYSIDGGLTYRTIPLFTKLSPGTYSTVIKDVSGRTTFSTVVLAEPPSPVIYQVSLQTQSTKQRNNSTIYTSTIKTSPALPSGVTITFDLVHTNTFRTSTTSTASTLTNSSLMKRNGRSFSANTTTTVTSTTLNTLAGCQDKTIFIRGKTETWSSVNYTSTTTLSFESTTLITKNLVDKCYVGDATDNFVITNLTISGCSSCGVVNGTV
jgi:hypothetical protein